MGSGRDGFQQMELLEGERLELTLDLRDGLLGESRDGGDVLLLTSKRIAYLSGGGVQNGAAFAFLEDVSTVEVRKSLKGMSALIWGIGALIIGFALWQTVGNEAASVILGIAMGVTGIYLIGDWLWPGERAVVVVQAGPAQIQGSLKGSRAAGDVHLFIDRVFQLKAQERDSRGYRRPFPPR